MDVNMGQETSQDRVAVIPCQVLSAPPGKIAMAKGTAYIWLRHEGMPAVCFSSREIYLPTWIQRTNTPIMGLNVVYGAAPLILNRKHIFGHV